MGVGRISAKELKRATKPKGRELKVQSKDQAQSSERFEIGILGSIRIRSILPEGVEHIEVEPQSEDETELVQGSTPLVLGQVLPVHIAAFKQEVKDSRAIVMDTGHPAHQGVKGPFPLKA